MILLLIGIAIGFMAEHLWNFCLEMWDLYREEREEQ